MNSRGFRVEFREVDKITGSYEGLAIWLEGSPNMQAVINLHTAYDEYVDYGLDDVIKKIVNSVKQTAPPNIDINEFSTFKEIKDKVFYRLSGGREQEFLDTIPHRDFYGLTISYHVYIDDTDSVGSALITNEMARNYGVSEQVLFETAKLNTTGLLKPIVRNMMDFLLGINTKAKEFSEQIEDIADNSKRDIMFILSNNKGVYGATTLLYDGILNQISNAIGDFYILPSSIHEVLIVPDNGDVKAEDLGIMVREVNNTEVKPEERLSYNVYHYDARQGFEVCI